MANLTGKKIANTYKQLLQVGSDNSGIGASVQTVQDGEGNSSALQLSNSAVNINGDLQLNGVTLTADASALNAIADLTGTTGIVAVSAGNVYGRSIAAGTGISVTNGDGTEGNPTIAINPSGVVSGSYGPLTKFAVNSVGQVVSATAVSAAVSIPTITANQFIGGSLTLSSDASIVGDVNIDGNIEVSGTARFDRTVSVSGSLVGSNATFSGTVSAGDISGANATLSGNVSAVYYYGDGSNLTNIVATSASFAASAAYAASATYASFAITATNANFAASASFASSASYAASAGQASFAVSASTAALATSATNATFALSATNATTAYNVSGGDATLDYLFATSASISDFRATHIYGVSVSADYIVATNIIAGSISATDIRSQTLSFFDVSVSSFTASNISVQSSISLPDNAKLNFGDSDDLQIYHDGSNSYVSDGGTGNLRLQGSGYVEIRTPGGSNMITAAAGAESKLWYNGSAKLATTNTGIDVTGNVTIDNSLADLTLDCDLNNLGQIQFAENGTDKMSIRYDATNNQLQFRQVGVQNHLVIDESTGAATFADTLSAGATTVQDGTISLTVGADDATTTLTNSTRKRGRIATPHYLTAEEPVGIAIMDAQAAANELSIGGGSGSVNAATKIKFYTAATYNTTTGTEALTIDSSQNVGIGITSPTYALHVARSGAGASSMVESFHATPGSYNESSFPSHDPPLRVI